jgi:hypothetical protein
MQNSGCPEFFRQKYHHLQPTQAGILTENHEILHNTWFTDEARVSLNDGVNKQLQILGCEKSSPIAGVTALW